MFAIATKDLLTAAASLRVEPVSFVFLILSDPPNLTKAK